MRFAALIFALVAGVLGVLALVFGSLGAGLAGSGLFRPDEAMLARAIADLVPALSWIGVGSVLAHPRIGGVVLLLSAFAWALLAAVIGHGALFFAALPFTFAAAAGIVGLFARHSRPAAETPVDDGAPDRGGEAEAAETVIAAARAPAAPGRPERPAAIAARRPASAPAAVRVEPAPPAPALAPPFRDDIADEPPPAPVAPPEPSPAQDPAALPEPPSALASEPALPAPSPIHARRPHEWSLPEPAPAPPQNPAVPPLAAAPAPVAATSPTPPAAPAPLDAGLDPQAALVVDPPDSYREALAERRRPEMRGRHLPADDLPAESPAAPAPPARGHRVRQVLRLAIALLFILILLGLAAAIYLDYRKGPNSVLFGHARHPAATGAAAAPTPAASSAPAPEPSAAALPATPHPVPLAPAPTPQTGAQPTGAPSTAAAPVSAIIAPAAPAGTFTEASAYCAAIGNIDMPDARYRGPAIPKEVAAALMLPPGTAPADVHWRCSDGLALACDARGTHACDMTPKVDYMLHYCAAHPNAAAMPAPNGSWSCNGTRPTIPPDQSWPVDARGFYPDAWTRASPQDQ